MSVDTYRFDVVWRGQWYKLANLSEHRKKNLIRGSEWLLIDRSYRTHRAPRSEVRIPDNAPLPSFRKLVWRPCNLQFYENPIWIPKSSRRGCVSRKTRVENLAICAERTNSVLPRRNAAWTPANCAPRQTMENSTVLAMTFDAKIEAVQFAILKSVPKSVPALCWAQKIDMYQKWSPKRKTVPVFLTWLITASKPSPLWTGDYLRDRVNNSKALTKWTCPTTRCNRPNPWDT